MYWRFTSTFQLMFINCNGTVTESQKTWTDTLFRYLLDASLPGPHDKSPRNTKPVNWASHACGLNSAAAVRYFTCGLRMPRPTSPLCIASLLYSRSEARRAPQRRARLAHTSSTSTVSTRSQDRPFLGDRRQSGEPHRPPRVPHTPAQHVSDGMIHFIEYFHFG